MQSCAGRCPRVPVCAREQVCVCVCVCVLSPRRASGTGVGSTTQRGVECRSFPFPWACDLCTPRALSFHQPLATRVLSSWEYPVVGPLSTDPTEPMATPWGTHPCAAGAFLVAAEPQQLPRHVLGDLQVRVTVTGPGTEGLPRPGEAPSILPPTASRSLQLWVWLGDFTDTNNTSLPVSARQGTPPPGSPP